MADAASGAWDGAAPGALADAATGTVPQASGTGPPEVHQRGHPAAALPGTATAIAAPRCAVPCRRQLLLQEYQAFLVTAGGSAPDIFRGDGPWVRLHVGQDKVQNKHLLEKIFPEIKTAAELSSSRCVSKLVTVYAEVPATVAAAAAATAAAVAPEAAAVAAAAAVVAPEAAAAPNGAAAAPAPVPAAAPEGGAIGGGEPAADVHMHVLQPYQLALRLDYREAKARGRHYIWQMDRMCRELGWRGNAVLALTREPLPPPRAAWLPSADSGGGSSSSSSSSGNACPSAPVLRLIENGNGQLRAASAKALATKRQKHVARLQRRFALHSSWVVAKVSTDVLRGQELQFTAHVGAAEGWLRTAQHEQLQVRRLLDSAGGGGGGARSGWWPTAAHVRASDGGEPDKFIVTPGLRSALLEAKAGAGDALVLSPVYGAVRSGANTSSSGGGGGGCPADSKGVSGEPGEATCGALLEAGSSTAGGGAGGGAAGGGAAAAAGPRAGFGSQRTVIAVDVRLLKKAEWRREHPSIGAAGGFQRVMLASCVRRKQHGGREATPQGQPDGPPWVAASPAAAGGLLPVETAAAGPAAGEPLEPLSGLLKRTAGEAAVGAPPEPPPAPPVRRGIAAGVSRLAGGVPRLPDPAAAAASPKPPVAVPGLAARQGRLPQLMQPVAALVRPPPAPAVGRQQQATPPALSLSPAPPPLQPSALLPPSPSAQPTQQPPRPQQTRLVVAAGGALLQPAAQQPQRTFLPKAGPIATAAAKARALGLASPLRAVASADASAGVKPEPHDDPGWRRQQLFLQQQAQPPTDHTTDRFTSAAASGTAAAGAVGAAVADAAAASVKEEVRSPGAGVATGWFGAGAAGARRRLTGCCGPMRMKQEARGEDVVRVKQQARDEPTGWMDAQSSSDGEAADEASEEGDWESEEEEASEPEQEADAAGFVTKVELLDDEDSERVGPSSDASDLGTSDDDEQWEPRPACLKAPASPTRQGKGLVQQLPAEATCGDKQAAAGSPQPLLAPSAFRCSATDGEEEVEKEEEAEEEEDDIAADPSPPTAGIAAPLAVNDNRNCCGVAGAMRLLAAASAPGSARLWLQASQPCGGSSLPLPPSSMQVQLYYTHAQEGGQQPTSCQGQDTEHLAPPPAPQRRPAYPASGIVLPAGEQVSLPPLQPGELRLCGLTFHPELAAGVSASMRQWEDGLRCPLASTDPATRQIRICGVPAEGAGAAFGPHRLKRNLICSRLAHYLGLSGEHGRSDAPLPQGPLGLVGVETCPAAPEGGGLGLAASVPLQNSAVIGILGGYVLPTEAAAAMTLNGFRDLPAQSRSALKAAATAAAVSGGSDGGGVGHSPDPADAWKLLACSYLTPLPPAEPELSAAAAGTAAGPDATASGPLHQAAASQRVLFMLGYGNLAALINDPRVEPRAWVEGNDVEDESGVAETTANCAVLPVCVRGLVLPVLVATRNIKPGEQLLRDYGAAWWRQLGEAWEVLEEGDGVSLGALLHACGPLRRPPPLPPPLPPPQQQRQQQHREEQEGQQEELQQNVDDAPAAPLAPGALHQLPAVPLELPGASGDACTGPAPTATAPTPADPATPDAVVAPCAEAAQAAGSANHQVAQPITTTRCALTPRLKPDPLPPQPRRKNERAPPPPRSQAPGECLPPPPAHPSPPPSSAVSPAVASTPATRPAHTVGTSATNPAAAEHTERTAQPACGAVPVASLPCVHVQKQQLRNQPSPEDAAQELVQMRAGAPATVAAEGQQCQAVASSAAASTPGVASSCRDGPAAAPFQLQQRPREYGRKQRHAPDPTPGAVADARPQSSPPRPSAEPETRADRSSGQKRQSETEPGNGSSKRMQQRGKELRQSSVKPSAKQACSRGSERGDKDNHHRHHSHSRDRNERSRSRSRARSSSRGRSDRRYRGHTYERHVRSRSRTAGRQSASPHRRGGSRELGQGRMRRTPSPDRRDKRRRQSASSSRGGCDGPAPRRHLQDTEHSGDRETRIRRLSERSRRSFRSRSRSRSRSCSRSRSRSCSQGQEQRRRARSPRPGHDDDWAAAASPAKRRSGSDHGADKAKGAVVAPARLSSPDHTSAARDRRLGHARKEEEEWMCFPLPPSSCDPAFEGVTSMQPLKGAPGRPVLNGMLEALGRVEALPQLRNIWYLQRAALLNERLDCLGMAAVLAAKELVRRGVLKLEQLRGDGGVALQLRCFPVRGLVLRVSVPVDSNRESLRASEWSWSALRVSGSYREMLQLVRMSDAATCGEVLEWVAKLADDTPDVCIELPRAVAAAASAAVTAAAGTREPGRAHGGAPAAAASEMASSRRVHVPLRTEEIGPMYYKEMAS